jgi:hypothetical protein
LDLLVNDAGPHSAEFNQLFAVLGNDRIRRLLDVSVLEVGNASLACKELMVSRGGGVIVPATRHRSGQRLLPVRWHLLMRGVRLEQIRGDRVLHEALASGRFMITSKEPRSGPDTGSWRTTWSRSQPSPHDRLLHRDQHVWVATTLTVLIQLSALLRSK